MDGYMYEKINSIEQMLIHLVNELEENKKEIKKKDGKEEKKD